MRARAMRRFPLRGGARRPPARRPRVGGVRGHVWAPQTKVRRPDCLARYVARRSRAPYLRRWALLIALDDAVDGACPYCVHCGLGSPAARASGCAAFLLDEGGAASQDGASSEGDDGTAHPPVRRMGLILSMVPTRFRRSSWPSRLSYSV